MSITRFNRVLASNDDWKRIKNHCRTTDNKDFTDKDPTTEFKKKLIISEHTPIRLLEFDWSWHDIPSWVATHWVRHKFEKFVSTQRDDRKKHDISRGKMPQDTPVNMDCYANAQQIIDAWRKRLCFKASPETRELAEDFKVAVYEVAPELSDALVPNCIYRCGCPEFETCGYFKKFMEEIMFQNSEFDLFDIQKRYKAYNEYFARQRLEKYVYEREFD